MHGHSGFRTSETALPSGSQAWNEPAETCLYYTVRPAGARPYGHACCPLEQPVLELIFPGLLLPLFLRIPGHSVAVHAEPVFQGQAEQDTGRRHIFSVGLLGVI